MWWNYTVKPKRSECVRTDTTENSSLTESSSTEGLLCHYLNNGAVHNSANGSKVWWWDPRELRCAGFCLYYFSRELSCLNIRAEIENACSYTSVIRHTYENNYYLWSWSSSVLKISRLGKCKVMRWSLALQRYDTVK